MVTGAKNAKPVELFGNQLSYCLSDLCQEQPFILVHRYHLFAISLLYAYLQIDARSPLKYIYNDPSFKKNVLAFFLKASLAFDNVPLLQ